MAIAAAWLVTGFVVLGSGVARAEQADPVLGWWADARSVVQIAEAPVDSVSMRVMAMMDPVYLADEAGEEGTPRVDAENPDAALRSRQIMGLELLQEYRFDDDQWRGTIYDPESGKTYSSRMWVDSDGNLRMRGFIGVSLFGRTAIFEPLASCAAHMVEVLRRSGLAGHCGM